MTLPKWMVRLGGKFSEELSNIIFLLDEPERTMGNDRSREILGIEYKRDCKDLLLAAAESMIEAGSVPMKRKKGK